MQKLLTHGRFLTFGAYPRKFVQLLESEWQIPAEKLLEGTSLNRETLEQPDVLVPFADCVNIYRNGVTLVLEIISDVPIDPVFTYDIIQLSSFNIMKMILGERTRELVFHFAHPAPAYTEAYAKYFDCHLQFNASFNGVSIPTEFLEIKIPTADEDTHRLLVGQIREQMESVHAQSSFVDAVRFHLKRQDGPLPRMSTVADAFNMSARTFRNRLRRHNTTYQTLLDRERHEQAVHYLRHSDKSVKEIAYVLGFQESSNFSRVFKKWTGVTPLDYRRGIGRAA